MVVRRAPRSEAMAKFVVYSTVALNLPTATSTELLSPLGTEGLGGDTADLCSA